MAYNRSKRGGTFSPAVRTTFFSLDDRDYYFTSNLSKITENMQIRVILSDEIGVSQYWSFGGDAEYNSDYWKTLSVQVGASSFHLSDSHTITAVGENVVFRNEVTGIQWFPVWQAKDTHPTGRIYGTDVTLELGGPRHETNVVPFDVEFDIQNSSTQLSEIIFVPKENYFGRIEYRITEKTTDKIMFTDIIHEITLVDGVEYRQVFNNPVELHEGTEVYARIIKNDGTYLSVLSEAGDTSRPYTTSTINLFKDMYLQFKPTRRIVDSDTAGNDLFVVNDEVIYIGPLTSDVHLIADSRATNFRIIDLDSNITMGFEITVTLDEDSTIIIDSKEDNVEISKHDNGYWSYYNYRNGTGELV